MEIERLKNDRALGLDLEDINKAILKDLSTGTVMAIDCLSSWKIGNNLNVHP